METKDIALNNFNLFKKFEGSEHIATISSQINILEILKKYPIYSVMDFGAGIGTLSNLIIKNTNVNLTAIEDNPFCIAQFSKHILPNKRVNLLNEIPRNNEFDFVIIDNAIQTRDIFRLFRDSKQVIVFIEGRRSSTVTRLSFLSIFFRLSRRFYHCESRLNLFGSKEIEKGGSYFIFTKSTLLSTISTWLSQFRETGELNEIKVFLFKIWTKLKFK